MIPNIEASKSRITEEVIIKTIKELAISSKNYYISFEDSEGEGYLSFRRLSESSALNGEEDLKQIKYYSNRTLKDLLILAKEYYNMLDYADKLYNAYEEVLKENKQIKEDIKNVML